MWFGLNFFCNDLYQSVFPKNLEESLSFRMYLRLTFHIPGMFFATKKNWNWFLQVLYQYDRKSCFAIKRIDIPASRRNDFKYIR